MKTFKSYLESQGKAKSTVEHYTTYILDFISYLDRNNGAMELENARGKEVMSYLSSLQKRGQSNKTRNIRLGVIKHYFNWQITRGHRTNNPVIHLTIKGIKRQKLYPVLDSQQLENLYHTYKVPKKDHPKAHYNWFPSYRLSKARNKSILSLLIHQGLTTPEIEKLQVNDLKLKQGQLYVAGSRRSNELLLELKSHQIMELMEYSWQIRPELLSYQKDKTVKRLFLPTPASGQKTATDGLQIWKSLTKEIKANNPSFINFKQVRTSVITHWIKQHNLRQVQYRAGHKYVNSTEAYLVNQLEDLKEDIDQFHPLG